MNIAQRFQRPLTGLAFAGLLVATPVTLVAQNGYPQPYNNQDPNNYSSPANQTYQQQYPNQGQPQQQYPKQGQPQQQYPDQGQDGFDQGPPQDAVQQAPPPLPDYDQPPAPEDGTIWTPGYWAYGPGGYYWVNGAWVQPPYVNALWTPGYWGSGPYGYFWNAGYWGNTIGYYGGINYGFGYFGTGYYGGYWNGGHFFYNRAYGHFGFRGGHFYNQPYAGSYGHSRPGGVSFTAVNRGYAPGFHGERGGTFNRQGADFRGRGFADNGRANFGGNQPRNNGAFNNRYPQQPANGAIGNQQPGNGNRGNQQPGGQNFGQGNYGGRNQPTTGYTPGAGNAGRQPYNGQTPQGGSYNRGSGYNPQSQMQRPAQTAPAQGNDPGRNFGGMNGSQGRPQQAAPTQAPRSAPSAPAGGGGGRSAPPPSGGGGVHGSGGHR